VQGCPIRCDGCAVPWTWDAHSGETVEVEELSARILSSAGIEGVTFLGGEPFAQAEALAELGGVLRAEGLSVVTFTGYVLESILRSKLPGGRALLSVTDLLIDGPFRKNLVDLSRPWVGSSNQRFHFITSRYRYLEEGLGSTENRLEIRITPDGQVLVNGLASTRILEQLFDQL
jgi:anaerobic ribonucleoside-triphosphate reductase activating protein